MRPITCLITCTLFAGILPLLVSKAENRVATLSFPGWPQTFQGRALIALPLSEREKTFTRDFPGVVGRFSDGQHEIILRWLQHETRRLHPASDCLKGSGYSISPRPIEKDPEGNQWGCFRANNQERALHVCERIFDERGGSWSDVSSWFWAALVGKSEGPWWAITVANADSNPS